MLSFFVKESEEIGIRLIFPSAICCVKYYVWPCFTKKDIGISWNILALPISCKYCWLDEMNLVSFCFTAFFSVIYSLCSAFLGTWNFLIHQPQCWFRSPFCSLDIFMIFSVHLWETGLPESKVFDHYPLPLTQEVSCSRDLFHVWQNLLKLIKPWNFKSGTSDVIMILEKVLHDSERPKNSPTTEEWDPNSMSLISCFLFSSSNIEVANWLMKSSTQTGFV